MGVKDKGLKTLIFWAFTEQSNFLWGSSQKTDIEGGLPKTEGLGEFGDLKGGLIRRRGGGCF